jgi:hypothetical protein
MPGGDHAGAAAMMLTWEAAALFLARLHAAGVT